MLLINYQGFYTQFYFIGFYPRVFMCLKKYTFIILAILFTLLTGCQGASSSGGTPDASNVAPSNVIVTVSPADNQKSIPVNLDTITVSFSDAINGASLTSQSISITPQASFHLDTSMLDSSQRSVIITLDSALLAETDYTVRISGVMDANGLAIPDQSWTFTTASLQDVTPPTAPGNLRTTSITSTQVSLAWDASQDESLAGYRIYRNSTLLTTTTQTSFTNTGLSGSTTYQYRVDAYDSAGNSTSSSTLSATTLQSADTSAPTAPGNLRSTSVTSTSVALAWNASTDNVGVTGYRVYRGTTLIATTPALSYTFSALSSNTTYQFRVDAVDAAGNATPSNTLNVTTLQAVDTSAPTVPGNFRFTSIGSTSVTMAWNASTDNVGVTGYRVYRGTTLVTTTTSLSYTASGLTSGATYQFHVDAIDAAGNTASSATLSVTLVANSTASLSWTPPTQNTDDSALTNLAGYIVYYGLSPTTLNNSVQVGSGLTAVVIDNLQAGVTYYFAISAVNSLGIESDKSNIVSKTTI